MTHLSALELIIVGGGGEWWWWLSPRGCGLKQRHARNTLFIY